MVSQSELAQLAAKAAQAKAEAAQAAAAAAQAAYEAALASASQESSAAKTNQVEPDEKIEMVQTPEADTVATEQTESQVQAQSDLNTAAAAAPTAVTQLSEYAQKVQHGYSVEEAIPLGSYLETGTPVASVPVTLPLSTMNRHGLIAGATGTGKTRTLQLLAEGLSNAGVPVFLTDIKGDLTGLTQPGIASPQLAERCAKQGQKWEAQAFPTEFYALGGQGVGIPIRTTVTDFGPLLLAKVLGLNETQESALSLIFHWADQEGLALIDLSDLRTVVTYLTSDEGKSELTEIGGVAAATAGVILREISALEAQGADEFFGEPGFDVHDFMRVVSDSANAAQGVLSILELPDLSAQPALFSTFIMWLLAELFEVLPEVGDVSRPKLVFFFDEAHLLFDGASKAFLDAVVRTVRLIRSKGVGVFFLTQTPKDIPADVLAQLGAKVQHALRAHTPNEQKALRETVKTFPDSGLDLESLLPSLGTGEAIVTVLDAKGRPSPVAPTKIWAPASVMGAAQNLDIANLVANSPLNTKYGERVDPESATELLAQRIEAERAAAEAARVHAAAEKAAAEEAERLAKELEKQIAAEEKAAQKELERAQRAAKEAQKAQEREAQRQIKRRERVVDNVVNSLARSIGTSIARSIFGNRRR